MEQAITDEAPASTTPAAGYPTPPDDDDENEKKGDGEGNQYDAIFARPTAEPTAIAIQEWYADGTSRTVMLEPFPIEADSSGFMDRGDRPELRAEVDWLRATHTDPGAMETGGPLITVMPWAVPSIHVMGRLRSIRVTDADGVSRVLDETGLLIERAARPGLPFPTLLTTADHPTEPATTESAAE